MHEAFLDELLRGHRFVDLYLVAREAVRTSEPKMSLKNLEIFYRAKSRAEVMSDESRSPTEDDDDNSDDVNPNLAGNKNENENENEISGVISAQDSLVVYHTWRTLHMDSNPSLKSTSTADVNAGSE